MLAVIVSAVTLIVPAQGTDPIAPDVISFFGREGGERIQGMHYHEPSDQVFVGGNTNSKLEDKYLPTLFQGRDRLYDANGDGFVARFSKNLRTLEAWTYLGGALSGPSAAGQAGDDRVYTVKTDSAGNVYAYGFSSTPKFFTDSNAVGGALQGRRDVFLAKLSNDLVTLHWVLRLGGNDVEASSGVSELEQGRNTLLVLDDGTCFVSGGTNNPDFFDDHAGVTPVVEHVARQQAPPQGSGVIHPGNFDAFLAKVDPGGTVTWGTFFGGDGDESAYSGIANRNGSVFVAGNVNDEDTASPGSFWGQSHPGSGLPGTTGCLETTAPCKLQETYQGGAHALGSGNGIHHIVGGDGFIAKFDGTTGALKWATYLGGSDFDEISGNEGFVIGASGQLYVCGVTKSSDFPMGTSGGTSGSTPFDGTLNASGQRDGFVAILNSSASELLHSTFLGGEGFEELGGLALDPYGYVYVGGNTDSGATDSNGLSSAPYPTTADAFQCQNYQTYPAGATQLPVTGKLTKLTPNLSFLRYSTYFGGSQLLGGGPSTVERIRSMFWITGDWCYVSGCTNSQDLASIHSNPPAGTCPALANPIPTGTGSLLNQLDPNNTGTNDDAFLSRIRLPFESQL